jgi:hypothetical protein
MATPQITNDPSVAAAVESSKRGVNSVAKFSFRFFAALLGLALLTTLVLRTGPQTIWNQVHKVGFGLVLVILLGGLAHLIRTWSWRLIVGYEITAVPWSRSFAACLVSEALGQLGVGGKVLGEGMRISLLRSAVPLTNAIPASAIDGGIHLVTSLIVMLSGITVTLLLAPLSGTWRNSALMFASAVIAVLILVFVSIGKRWALMGNAARAIERVPRFHNWTVRRLPVIDSSEQNLLDFLHKAPARFCAAFLLNFLWQAITILEIYIILRFMGTQITVLGASVMEGLTKLINLVGAFNPGNVGTYEGGNMLITKLFSVAGTVGLTLALCRRACVLFWASIGAICLMLMRTPNEHRDHDANSEPSPGVAQL